MAKIFLINVGANDGHKALARSPFFGDGSFVFVPFPTPGKHGVRPYPTEAHPFLRGIDIRDTHCDPDWQDLTYGDDISNPRAKALRHVVKDDVLLFWSLLWPNAGNSWAQFTGEQRWCLIGALRVREILGPKQRPEEAKSSRVERAKQNVHFYRGKLDLDNYVFIGCTKHSSRFPKAVDLQVRDKAGLVYRTIQTAKGAPLKLNGKPSGSSSLRSCRKIWDLDIPEQRARAKVARQAILRQTGYDMLDGL